MRFSNGRVLIFLGIIHALMAVSPLAFGKQFMGFSRNLMFKISDGLSEFPILSGQMNYENFAAFWFFYFGLLLIPLGFLVLNFEKKKLIIPVNFVVSYFIVVLIGVFMIPFSGMTLFMLPHALYMLFKRKKIHLA